MQKKSFTLIEMLIVVVIIGILAAALIPRLQSVQARARDTKRKADLHQIATALEIYKEDNGGFNVFAGYTDLNGFGTFPISNYQGDSSNSILRYSYMNTLLSRYMTSIPTDINQAERSPNIAENQGIRGYGFSALPKGGIIRCDTNPGKCNLQSFVLYAKTESDGSSSNRVSNSSSDNRSCGGAACQINGSNVFIGDYWALGGDRGWDSTPYASADFYNQYVCSKVLFDSGTYNDGNGNCSANKNGDDLRYIYVN